jgi:hypothetical protein
MTGTSTIRSVASESGTEMSASSFPESSEPNPVGSRGYDRPAAAQEEAEMTRAGRHHPDRPLRPATASSLIAGHQAGLR